MIHIPHRDPAAVMPYTKKGSGPQKSDFSLYCWKEFLLCKYTRPLWTSSGSRDPFLHLASVPWSGSPAVKQAEGGRPPTRRNRPPDTGTMPVCSTLFTSQRNLLSLRQFVRALRNLPVGKKHGMIGLGASHCYGQQLAWIQGQKKKSRILNPEIVALFPELPDVVRIVVTTMCKVWPQGALPQGCTHLSIVSDLCSSFHNRLLLCYQLIQFQNQKSSPIVQEKRSL